MSQDQIIKRHQHAFRQFGHHPNALLWSGIKIQYLRFEQLAKINIQTGILCLMLAVVLLI